MRSILIDGAERADITRVESIRITTKAGGDGEAGLGELILDDVPGTLIDSGTRPDIRKTWIITEDATVSPTVLGFGRIGNYETNRHDPKNPSDRQVDWKLFLEDGNIELRGFDVHNQSRPSETDYARFQWVASTYLNGSPRASTVLDYTTYVPNTNTVTLEAKVYNNADVIDVIHDCMEQSLKICFVNPDGQIFYDLKDSTAYTSSISISDRLADVNQTTVFEPIWDQGPALNWEGQTYASRMRMSYGNNQSVIVGPHPAEGDHDYWTGHSFSSDPLTTTQATGVATNDLNFRAKGVRTYSLSLLLANDQVDLIKVGQRIPIKARAAVDVDNAYEYRRIAQLQWEVESPEFYYAHIQLDQPITAHAVGARGVPGSGAGAPDCADTTPFAFSLNVDSGWTKVDDADYPPVLPEYKAANIYASGTGAIIGHGLEERYDEPGPSTDEYSYYSGCAATKDDYSPAVAEEMLFRFNWMELGDYGGVAPGWQFLSNTDDPFGGAVLSQPFTDPPSGVLATDGMIRAAGGSDVDYAWETGQSYYIRVIRGGGSVKVWKVEEAEPGGWTATGGSSSQAGGLSFVQKPVTNVLFHDNDYLPAMIEVEALTVYQLIEDPNCFDYGDLPHDSGYYVPSDTIQAIKDTIVTDHGGLTGLSDDDHTQYIKDAEFTAKGDLLVGTGSGTFDNLAVGTNSWVLTADSTQTTGVKWAASSGMGGDSPFEDAGGGTWTFISTNDTIASTDASAFLELSTDDARLHGGAANEIEVTSVTGKIGMYSDYGVVLPIVAEPGGGDSENGQIIYESGTDKFRAYENGVWVDMIGVGLGAWTDYTPTLTAVTTNPTLGSSVVTGRYKLLDANTYIVRVQLAVTTGGAWNAGSGEWKFSLPSGLTAAGTLPSIGSAQVLDSGVGYFSGTCQVTSGQTVIWPIVMSDDTGNRILAHNKPVTWATGDRVFLEVIVEV